MSWVAVLLALGAAMVFAVGAVAQQQEAANVDAHGSQFVAGLLRSPRWWAATFADGFGYLLQAAGLAVGSILVVQPLLIASLVFALPLSARWNQRPIHRRDLAWALAIAVALAAFLVVGSPGGGVETNPFSRWVPAIIGCAVVVAIAVGMIVSGRPRARAVGLAIVAGTLFGFASAVTKSATHLLGDDLSQALHAWEFYALIGTGGVGLLCQQLAFQAGALELSFPAAVVLDPVVSVAVGAVALDERVHADGIEWLVIGLSALVMIAGTLALARAGAPTSPTQTADVALAPRSPAIG